MRGIVLDCSTEKDSGILRCDNGHRYPFLGQDWHSELLPRAGQDVDFVVEGDVAADIYLLRHGASSISAMALVSFITGIFGLFFFGSLIAVICGHVARSHIRKSHGVLGGDGFAVAGLVLGYIGLSFKKKGTDLFYR